MVVETPGCPTPTNGGGSTLGAPERDSLIADLRAARARFSLAITGGGFQAVTDLLTRPGASDIVHDIEIPYHPTAMGRLLPRLEGPAVSSRVAVGLARSALVRMDRDLSGGANPGEAAGHGLGVTAALATDRELNELIRLRDQQREVSWLVVSGNKLLEDYAPSEEELKQYYEQHKEQWLIPERVKVEYILLGPDVVAKSVEVTDEGLKEYWRQHQAEFHAPEERRVRHILISAPEGADAETEEAARARAQDVYRRLQAGEKFEELARELSQDPGSREQGGDLGWISHGIMAKAFEDAAFALKKGEISHPVRTPFGYHIIEVTEVKSGGEGDFESMRKQVETAYRRHQAEQLLFDKAEKLADLTYENPDELAGAAEELGLKVEESDWFDRNGGKGPLASPKVVGAAFSEDVLQERHNSELIELDDDQVLVLRVVDHEAEQIPAYEQVKEKVAQALRRTKAAELARERGEGIEKAISSGASTLEQMAGKGGWKLMKPRMLGRQATQAPAEVVKKAFGLRRPEAGKPSAAGTALTGGDYAVLVVTAVKDGDPGKLDEAQRKREREQLAQRKGTAQFNLLGRYLREHADVEITAEKK